MPSIRRYLPLTAVVLALPLAPPAFADGAGSIASAPTVVYEQQSFGNTADPNTSSEGCGGGRHAWWSLPTSAGDRITVDFEGTGAEYARVWPVGTTDFNVEDKNYRETKHLGSNDKAQLVFTSPQTGTMPLEFTTDICNFSVSGEPGSYDFTAYVRHAVRLAVPRRESVSRVATMRIGAHTPDGASINDPSLVVTLQAHNRGGKFRRVGSASVQDGRATVSYTLPKSWRKHDVYLRAVATGPNYVTETSPTQHSVVK
ncbi:MAG TPA: hypothetical protein VJT75_01380 [Thermoleophilaceae bacterium]|nr:hypothetical protein [Thermoleophilaceae bacterium]